jgi:hypothetical protein
VSKPIRVWLDELMGLPEYSCSLPTGTYPGKQWRCAAPCESGWYIGTYGEPTDPQTIPIFWHEVVLLQGPRRRNERSRLNPNGRRGSIPSHFPQHGGRP